MLDLGTLPGGKHSQANAINDREEIVGSAQVETGDFHAVFWKQGVMTDLGVLPRGTESAATALNNRGEAVGWAVTEGGGLHAVIWKDGHIQDLNRLVPYQADRILEWASAINDTGQIECRGVYRGRYRIFLLTPRH